MFTSVIIRITKDCLRKQHAVRLNVMQSGNGSAGAWGHPPLALLALLGLLRLL